MSDICGIDRITPRWGFCLRGNSSSRRALPYAIDLWAFSPMCGTKLLSNNLIMEVLVLSATRKTESPRCGEKLLCNELPMQITTLSIAQKAESLSINSVGQRPTKQNAHANLKPQRGVINLIINH